MAVQECIRNKETEKDLGIVACIYAMHARGGCTARAHSNITTTTTQPSQTQALGIPAPAAHLDCSTKIGLSVLYQQIQSEHRECFRIQIPWPKLKEYVFRMGDSWVCFLSKVSVFR